MNRIEFGDCRETLQRLKDEGVTVQMCVTSPPYYGLRDYGTGNWIGGDPNCSHKRDSKFSENCITGHKNLDGAVGDGIYKSECPRCGAIREDNQIGLEETPEEYVQQMVEVFRGVRDILADDGVIWVNIGDSYYNYRQGNAFVKQSVASNRQDLPGYSPSRNNKLDGLKNKDLIGIPWMLAFALRADGWYLRQDIIWHKPNPMPESVRDRCTKAHEYIFLLSKSKNYYFDHEAIKEPLSNASISRLNQNIENQIGTTRANGGAKTNGNFKASGDLESGNRNKRSVWTVNTKPYKGSHFAVYPTELIEPCILAGSSEMGHCPECGSKWNRIIEKTRLRRDQLDPTDPNYRPNRYDENSPYTNINGKGDAGFTKTKTLGWEPTCDCGHDPVPDIVLDPFMGSGTTAYTAMKLGRQYLGCELNPEYKELQDKRIAEAQQELSSSFDGPANSETVQHWNSFFKYE
jgi:DNA modification methylase